MRSCPALWSEHTYPTAGAHALHFRQSNPVFGLRLQQLRENPAKPVARLDVASGHRLDGAADARAGIGESNLLRPAPLEDHLLPDVERIFAEGQSLRDLFGEDHPLAEEEAVARIRHDALVELADRIAFLLRNLDETGQRPPNLRTAYKGSAAVIQPLPSKGPSAAAALRTREQVPIPHQGCRVHAAHLAGALDTLGELRLESGPRVF